MTQIDALHKRCKAIKQDVGIFGTETLGELDRRMFDLCVEQDEYIQKVMAQLENPPLRPTESSAVYAQQFGRAKRVALLRSMATDAAQSQPLLGALSDLRSDDEFLSNPLAQENEWLHGDWEETDENFVPIKSEGTVSGRFKGSEVNVSAKPREVADEKLDAHKGDDLNDKLLPCPFCGCDNIESIHRHQQYSKWQYTCQCGSCGAESTFEATKDAAIAMWNKRSPSEQLTQTQQKLNVAVEAFTTILRHIKVRLFDNSSTYEMIADTVDEALEEINSVRER